jgi:dephospho-CoA kinase
LLHPLVLGKMQDIVDNSRENVVIFEVPLLFEAKLEKCFDFIVLITADESLRIARLSAERGIPAEASQTIMRHQLPDDIKIAGADIVIYNNSSIRQLENAAADFMQRIHSIPGRETIPFNQIIDES